MRHRLLKPKEVEGYRSLISVYHPSGEIVLAFARSNFAVIAGPSGAGKDTVRNELVKDPKFVKVLSSTSRPPREGEVDGEVYHFKDLKFFDQGMKQQRFLQVALVHDQQLSCLDFEDIRSLSPDQSVVAILVPQTEIQLRRLKSDMRTVFLIAPSLEELKFRMSFDGIKHEELARRLESAKKEMTLAMQTKEYFCLINDDLNETVAKTKQFFSSGKIDEAQDQKARILISEILNSIKG